MKQTEFTITFKSCKFVRVMAFCAKEACIVAQADMIKAGLSYDIANVVDQYGNVYRSWD